MNDFCVYTHDVSRNGERHIPFYVGKGRPPRAQNLHRNVHHDRIVAKHGKANIRVTLWGCGLTNAEAMEREVELIAFLKEENVQLTNMTVGGEGTTGCKFSEETKRKMSAILIGNKRLLGHRHSDEAKKLISEKIREAYQARPEIREKQRQASLGNRRALGFKHTKATLEKLRVASTGRVQSDETKKKIGDAQRGPDNHAFGKSPHNFGVPMSDAQKVKLSNANRGKMWVTNGETRKCVFPQEAEPLLALGWHRGRK